MAGYKFSMRLGLMEDEPETSPDQRQNNKPDPGQMALKENTDRVAIEVKEGRFDKETRPTCDCAGNNKNRYVKVGNAACDGHQDKGNGCEALGKDNPGAIAIERMMEMLKGIFQMIGGHNPLAKCRHS